MNTRRISQVAASFATLAALTFSAGAIAAAPSKLLIDGASNSNWVLHVDDTRQWVSSTCAADLTTAGLTTETTDWPNISGFGTGTWIACAEMVADVTAAGGSSGGGSSGGTSGGVTLLLNGPVTSPADSAWLLAADDTRQWISASCRIQLQAAGITELETDWPEISSYPAGGFQACDDIEAQIGSSGGSSSGGSSGSGSSSGGPVAGSYSLLLNGSTTSSAWVLHPDETRQWVDGVCLADLQAAGITEVQTDWPGISQYSQGTWLSCSAIADNLGGSSSGGSSGTGSSSGSGSSGSGSGSSGGSSGGGSSGGNTGGPLPDYAANCLGINDGFSYSWDGGQLATDAFKNARPGMQDSYTAFSPTDAQGWPVDLANTNIGLAEGDHDLDKLNPWVLLPYEQSGDWLTGPLWGSWIVSGATHVGAVDYNGVVGHEFNLGSSTNTLKIFQGSIPASPRNRWHLVPKSVAADYAAAMQAENFSYIFDTDKYGLDIDFPLVHEETKTQMQRFCRIRYMLGENINSLDFSGRSADRNTPSHPTFNTPGGDGIPYEWETWIANHLSVNVWHGDHVKTWDELQNGDSYLSDQASYFSDNLRGSIVREYANEIWNTAPRYAAQTFWVWENGPYPDPGRTNFKWMHHNYGARAYDTALPWIQAFSGNREKLDLTIALHTSWPASLLWRFEGPNGEDWSDRADSIGGTWYFGQPLIPGNDRYNEVVANGVQGAANVHDNELAGIKSQIAEVMQLSDGFVDRYHLYEGGSHMYFINYDEFNAEHVQALADYRAFANSPAYTADLNDFASWWAAQPKSGELFWFNLYGRNTPDEPWGYYTSTGDSTPNFTGGQDFVENYSNF